jgi:hypothetical protein
MAELVLITVTMLTEAEEEGAQAVLAPTEFTGQEAVPVALGHKHQYLEHQPITLVVEAQEQAIWLPVQAQEAPVAVAPEAKVQITEQQALQTQVEVEVEAAMAAPKIQVKVVQPADQV